MRAPHPSAQKDVPVRRDVEETMTRISITSDRPDSGEWIGDLGQFIAENEFSDEEILALMCDLETHGEHLRGGGAAPVFRIRYADPITAAEWNETTARRRVGGTIGC